MSIDELLEFAAEHLPNGCSIEIGVEHGSAWANLIDPAGDENAEACYAGEVGWATVIVELINEARDLQGLAPVEASA